MDHTVEVFYVTRPLREKSGTTREEDVAKFFSLVDAETFMKDKQHQAGFDQLAVSLRVERWADQHVSHRPG